MTLYNCPKGGCSQLGSVPRNQWQDERTEHGLKLHQGRFKKDVRRNFFTESVVKHWNRLPRVIVESPALVAFKKQLEVLLSTMV